MNPHAGGPVAALGPPAPGVKSRPPTPAGVVSKLLVLFVSAVAAVPSASLAAPSKLLLSDPSDPRLAELARVEAAARKWGMNSPHPELAFDAGRYSGNVARRNALVILIDFDDKPGSFPGGNFENMLFSRGTYSTGSMRDFYLENSYGTLDINGQVVGWVRSEKTYEYYHDFSFGLNFDNGDRNARGMAAEALRLVDPFVDFTLFDNDGPDGIPSSGDDDGYLDALLVVHPGSGGEETNNSRDILSHQAYLSNDQIHDGVRALVYTTEPEDGRVGVFAHEFGHILGLPDLYDLSGGVGSGLGLWSLMGTGVWLNNGRTPSHLDGWSKVSLGFVEPEIPGSNTAGVTLPPSEEEPVAYKIWTNGCPGTEYFIAERREKRGFDSYLPGEGMLLYHVDESVRLQNDRNHYRVALEQADGQKHLEFQFGNEGDTGDPFPGATNNRFFTPSSNPSSLSYDGEDTQVSITDIRNDQGRTVFDLEVETEPEFLLTEVTIVEIDGDGDGWFEAGERGAVTALVRNVGLGAFDVGAAVQALNPSVTVETGSVLIGTVNGDSSFAAEFFISASSDVDDDPFEMAFHLEISATVPKVWNIPFSVGGGQITGLSDDFEGEVLWSHGPVTEERSDAWVVVKDTLRSHSKDHSWGFGGGEGYPNLADGALVSPPILLREGSELSFFYWMRAESVGSLVAWDGGRVEISHKGGPWQPLEPLGGYPFSVLEDGDTPLARQGVFSGERDWKRVVADLSGFSGLVKIRFRFVSDGSVTREGWYIDDVLVTSRDYTAALEDVRVAGDAVLVEVRVSEVRGPYNGAGFNVYRSSNGEAPQPPLGGVPSDFVLLNSEPLKPDGEGLVAFKDEEALWGRVHYYLVEDLGPAPGGVPSYLGPRRIYLCLGLAQPSMQLSFPNPFTPGNGNLARLFVTLPDPRCEEQPSSVEARIIDVAGRRVREIPVSTVPSGVAEIVWDGRDQNGDLVPSGVYLWWVQISGSVFGQKLIVVR